MLYDLIVVGAGPVGSYLAWKFSEKGYKVLVVDKKPEIGKPLACSGHVSENLWKFVPGLKDKVVQNKIREARFHVGENKYSYRKNKTQTYVVNRVKLEKFLVKRAIQAGAGFKLSKNFVNLMRGKNITVETEGREFYKTKVLGGCDGPLSRVRLTAGFKGPKRFLQGIITFKRGKNRRDYVDIYTDIPGFFAWKIPRGGYTEYGLATELKHKPKKLFNGFCKSQGIKPYRIYSGLIPILPGETAENGVFLCGDAAAQVKPFTGGGLVYGMTAADIASKTIDPDKPDVSRYDKAWRNELGKEICLGYFMKGFYNLPKPVKRLGLKILQDLDVRDIDRPSDILKNFVFQNK